MRMAEASVQPNWRLGGQQGTQLPIGHLHAPAQVNPLVAFRILSDVRPLLHVWALWLAISSLAAFPLWTYWDALSVTQ